MTQRTITVYTCERCRQDLSRRLEDGPPSDWGRMQHRVNNGHFREKIGHFDDPHTHVDLCSVCSRSLMRWWGEGIATEIAEPPKATANASPA